MCFGTVSIEKAEFDGLSHGSSGGASHVFLSACIMWSDASVLLVKFSLGNNVPDHPPVPVSSEVGMYANGAVSGYKAFAQVFMTTVRQKKQGIPIYYRCLGDNQ